MLDTPFFSPLSLGVLYRSLVSNLLNPIEKTRERALLGVSFPFWFRLFKEAFELSSFGFAYPMFCPLALEKSTYINEDQTI